MNYQRINNITGWSVFAVASYTFFSTLEPTGSFWDCGEFIASAYKLQVGHPPGAPLFMMIARFFAVFAGSDVKLVPVLINSISALSSAFTILFLFWTITLLMKKIMVKNNEPVNNDMLITIMGSGLVGALAYTFSDSFWFSAVEGEVYATSSFFTAFVFWAIFKWESVANEKHADRWIILIAFMMGLSIGIHLLNLVAIPALVFVYYFKKYKPSRWGIVKTAAASIAILAIIQYGIIAQFVNIGSKFDLLFVNSFGLPFWSGFIFFSLLVVALLVYGLNHTVRKSKPLFNTALLCVVYILFGYSTYAAIIIRSNANPPMDENNPEDAFSLLGYLNREQYGDRPLFKGQYFNAKVIDQEEGAMTYHRGEDKYIETGRKIEPVYDPKAITLFPRMFSSQDNHVSAYKEWAEIKGEQTPTMSQNMKFLWVYQLGHMYWRYFMWNFAGRQNDNQGHGGILKGNWLSGIQGLDALRLGPQDTLPQSMKQNKAYNKFYFLPLILGLAGLIYHFRKDTKDASVVMLLFFFTGIAIVLYLNQTPFQPRERDYAYVGSFYAFAIWIGMGVAFIKDLLKDKVPGAVSGAVITLVCLALVPGIMAKEGWDDHNRSHRYTSRDIAHNYLNSCAPNAILFTNGDNDTFPLWYAQEVEGIRTDVRVVNLSLLNTDWYIDQMKRKAYDSDPVPFSWTSSQYVQGTRDYVPFYDRPELSGTGYAELKDMIAFIGSDNPQAKARTQGGGEINYYPTKKFKITVDRETVLKTGTVSAENADKIVPVMEWEIGKNYLMKADLMILDLLANNNWKRPVYFAVTVGGDSYMNLEPFFQLEGLAYRVVPIKTAASNEYQPGRVQADVMYDNMLNKFLFGNMNDERVYLDQNNLNMTMNLRNNFGRLAETLYVEGKKDSAAAVLDKCLKEMPDKTVPFNIMMLRIADLYYKCGTPETRNDTSLSGNILPGDVEMQNAKNKERIEKANSIVKRLADIYEDDLNYYLSLTGSYAKLVDREKNQSMAVMQELTRMSRDAKQDSIANNIDKRYRALETRFYGKP